MTLIFFDLSLICLAFAPKHHQRAVELLCHLVVRSVSLRMPMERYCKPTMQQTDDV